MTSEPTSEPTPAPATQSERAISEPVTASPAKKAWKENAQTFLIAIILAIVIRIFVAEPRFIPSDSMTPTLQVGDRLVVEKLTYYTRSPQPGDIVVFDPPPQLQSQGYAKDQAFIKRVIATPGQTVAVQDGRVWVDGQPLTEPYIAESPSYKLIAPAVPPEHVFVMGDNRNNSNDSHIWGFLPQKNIIGRAWLRFYPFSRSGIVR